MAGLKKTEAKFKNISNKKKFNTTSGQGEVAELLPGMKQTCESAFVAIHEG
eukprot:CAMPEP_0170506490 /NCGR_PEP_ID=MMETSP0208-20121228/55114_1 /TAXON_ID=197538 /ORGANISM="Strombidium inclinatum, Strain S3" /LENGTH=50 /DNA_ID=CAMNT_0010788055 /DNA_START=122 /DNA_END=271 /DNA_ORIENTATION=+